jgi:hypothetical protein
MRRVNGWLTLFWIAMVPVSYEVGARHRAGDLGQYSHCAGVPDHFRGLGHLDLLLAAEQVVEGEGRLVTFAQNS